jgi:hypothetical protein
MRYSCAFAMVAVVSAPALSQPGPKPAGDSSKTRGIHFWQGWPSFGYVPANDARMAGAYLKVEALGWLNVSQQVDADPKTLQVYSRYTGADVGPSPAYNLARSFELFLGADRQLVNAAKQLNHKGVIVEGDLVIVHGPIQLQFAGDGTESLGETHYAHPPPRYVIKVRRLTADPARGPDEAKGAYVKMEVRGVLDTKGTNPTFRDMTDGKAAPGTVIRTDQCNLYVHLGKDDKWLARAKELNGKPAVVRGELIAVPRNPPDLEKHTKPFGLIVPHPFFMLSVTDLQAAPKLNKEANTKPDPGQQEGKPAKP